MGTSDKGPGASWTGVVTDCPLPNTEGMTERLRWAPSISTERLEMTHCGGGMPAALTVYSRIMKPVLARSRKILSPEDTHARVVLS